MNRAERRRAARKRPAYELARNAVAGAGPVRTIVPPDKALAKATANDRALEMAFFELLGTTAVAVRRLAALEGRDPEEVLAETFDQLEAGEV